MSLTYKVNGYLLEVNVTYLQSQYLLTYLSLGLQSQVNRLLTGPKTGPKPQVNTLGLQVNRLHTQVNADLLTFSLGLQPQVNKLLIDPKTGPKPQTLAWG